MVCFRTFFGKIKKILAEISLFSTNIVVIKNIKTKRKIAQVISFIIL